MIEDVAAGSAGQPAQAGEGEGRAAAQGAARTLHVHVGAHKTGSTALQEFLRDRTAELSAHGMIVPQTGRLAHDQPGHHPLAWEVHGREPDRGLVAALLEEIADAPSAVISSEEFEHAPPERLTAFIVRLRAAGWTPHFIWFHRNRADYAVAMHHELGKWGLQDGFLDTVRRIRREGEFTARNGLTYWFDPGAFARRWPAPLTTMDYDREKADLAGAFCRAIGVPAIAPAPPNVNYTPRSLSYRIKRQVARAVL